VLLEVEFKFWKSVQQGTPPSPDGSERTKELLTKLYPQPIEGAVVELSGDAIDWDVQREEALTQIKSWESQRLIAENQLRGAIGPAERGVLPNGIVYSWLATERKGYTVPATTVRTLRRLKGA
jgi:hypothetical protein